MDGLRSESSCERVGRQTSQICGRFRRKIENSELPSGLCCARMLALGLHLRYTLQPRRQMNRRNDAASAAATKFNGRKLKWHQTPVAT
jgi:hypothetical protein